MTKPMKQTESEQATPRTDVALDAFRNSVGFQFMFVLHSGLEMERAIDHVCSAAKKLADERVRDARREDDEDFIKLVRQLAAMNTSVYGLVEAIIEDVGYGAHRVDREYARTAAEAKGE